MPHALARTTVCTLVLLEMAASLRAQTNNSPPPAQSVEEIDPQATYDAAKDLFDQYAPPEVKEQYEFPSFDDFNTFATKLQAALDGGSLQNLAAYEPQAKAALAYLRQSPDTQDYADWLAGRIDEIDAARQIMEIERQPAPVNPPSPGVRRPTPPPKVVPSPGSTPKVVPVPSAHPAIPYYALWLQRVKGRSPPANSAEIMPVLRKAFAAEGVPPDLAWLAEVESSLNPKAHNPSGARGLFQLMPDTAKGLGLSTFLPDQRTDPEKSAHAAAHYLAALHSKFGSWPLAIAAYNAGENRVSKLLAANRATDFAGIASSLPAGTRMYVPEVCALVATRTGHPVTG